jgi:hypothetical protein
MGETQLGVVGSEVPIPGTRVDQLLLGSPVPEGKAHHSRRVPEGSYHPLSLLFGAVIRSKSLCLFNSRELPVEGLQTVGCQSWESGIATTRQGGRDVNEPSG